MDLSKYSYRISENILEYEFLSIGTKGTIKKIVSFYHIQGKLYNLAFGDLNLETGRVDHNTVTSNGDGDQVLSTVAMIVSDFTLQYPGAFVIIRGSTPSRTRLYRIGIARIYDFIKEKFEVYGLIEGGWEIFELNTHYEAFIVHRKSF